ncbi:hypothetical protein B6N60_04457 [Richelia sinica FACHB-800]|uniref:Uncharacterized protein n=1 Tax=Richelia sinica FACHB-800 TaxID=1357546 RepID=A0A975Y6Y0_9NOST|nr:hypothetical protein [Richelia sinica]MBD2665735.1 hypothetical protein [Richelia sinica FACHB-800]QXE25737.1 hypothetical protein B6N60_04457 [Richelia sinica FACHB-800]
MNKINRWYFCLIYLFFSNIYASISLAAGGGNTAVSPEEDTTLNSDTSTTVLPTTNTSINPSIETSSYLNTNTLNQGISAFSSSFSGYSSYGSQCGLSISGGYINNGNQDIYQIFTTFNTNPCTNQSNLEKIRQENENKREVIRASASIITTCINARSAAIRNGVNPDTICQLSNFSIPNNP